MILVGCASAFAYMLALYRVPEQLTDLLMGISQNPIVILLILNLILLALGMVMDMAALILILTPIIVPVLDSFGIDHVQFGVIMVLNLMVGLITPPVGLLLFIMARIAKVSLAEVIRACLPFMIPLLVVLILTSLVPALTLTVPALLFGE